MALTFQNNPAHVKEVAAQGEAKREGNAQLMTFGFWAGLVLGGLSFLALAITWMTSHSGGH